MEAITGNLLKNITMKWRMLKWLGGGNMTSKSAIEAIHVQKARIDALEYGQIVLTIQAGKVQRMDYHESYLIKEKVSK